jgi:hypothetical protein
MTTTTTPNHNTTLAPRSLFFFFVVECVKCVLYIYILLQQIVYIS